MADDSRPLRSGRYYSEAELAAAALAAVHRVVGHGKAYPTRAALIDALNVDIEARNALRVNVLASVDAAADAAGATYTTGTAALRKLHKALDGTAIQVRQRKPEKPVTAPGLSAALALADPSRPAATYDRGQRIRRLLLRRLPPGFVVAEEPQWSGEPDPTDVLPGL